MQLHKPGVARPKLGSVHTEPDAALIEQMRRSAAGVPTAGNRQRRGGPPAAPQFTLQERSDPPPTFEDGRLAGAYDPTDGRILLMADLPAVPVPDPAAAAMPPQFRPAGLWR